MSGFWRIWLQIWCSGVLLFGVMFAAAFSPGLDAPARLFYDAVQWPLDGQGAFDEPMYRFTVAILGAVMIGWALTVRAIVRAGAAAAPLWRGVTFAMAAWYGIDSALSIVSGFPMNALFNTIFLATFLAPVLGSGVLRAATPKLTRDVRS